MDSLDSQMRHVERVNWCRGLMRMRVGRHHSTSPASQVGSLHVSRQLSLPLVTTILEADLHLANNFVESVKYFLHLTWVSVKWSEAARAALSLLDKYLFRSNVDSSWKT